PTLCVISLSAHTRHSPPRCFFLHAPATPDIYTLSLTTLFRSAPTTPASNAAPVPCTAPRRALLAASASTPMPIRSTASSATARADRKSTRLNSSHSQISYAVFCLKKKKIKVHADAPTYLSTYNKKNSSTSFSSYIIISNLYKPHHSHQFIISIITQSHHI